MTRLANQEGMMGIGIDDQGLFMMAFKDNQNSQFKNQKIEALEILFNHQKDRFDVVKFNRFHKVNYNQPHNNCMISILEIMPI